jgi:hypothetical protein
MSIYLPAELRQQLIEADGKLCAYCQTSVDNTGQRLTIDHIYPQAKGGMTIFDNLCLACRLCNESKGDQVSHQDPSTGETVPLFHPRRDSWHDHFQWDESGTRLQGLTAIGRATIVALNMNNELIVSARDRWVGVGWHPPD